MKKIYILLSLTGTMPANIINKIKGGRFAHVSLSLTPSTDMFYSFARRKAHNTLVAGFVTENIHTGVFSKYPECDCVLYTLDITDKAYEIISDGITDFMKNYKRAKYNIVGMFALAFGIRIKRKYRLTCSQFVALMLHRTGEIKLPKDPFLMLPNDFMDIKELRLIYEGPLKDCSIPADALIEL